MDEWMNRHKGMIRSNLTVVESFFYVKQAKNLSKNYEPYLRANKMRKDIWT